jgi:DNA-binding beta-propeller fold protein YncE
VVLLVVPGIAVAESPPPYLTQWGGYGSADGQFYLGTHGVAVDSGGSVYVADYGNNRIQKFTNTGAFVTKWPSCAGGGCPGGPEPGQLNGPTGVAVDSSGNVYVVDHFGEHRIQKFTSSGAFITTWGTSGTGPGQFNFPWGVAIDSDGNVYVSDTNNRRVQKFTSSGTFLTMWGSPGTDPGQFGAPTGIAVDSNGTVYVTDENTHRLEAFSSSGTFLDQWGCLGACTDFWHPYGVTVDRNDDVYVGDTGNNRVRKLTGAGAPLATWGVAGTGPGQFNSPSGVAVDSNGNVFVADAANNRIQKFGGGPAAAVRVAPSSLSYGARAVGDPSLAKTVTVTNTTATDVNVLLIDVVGPAALDFYVDLETCTLAPLMPLASCSINVSFTPTAVGGRSATLTLDSDGPGTPHTVNLSGFGALAPFAPARIGARAPSSVSHLVPTPRPLAKKPVPTATPTRTMPAHPRH